MARMIVREADEDLFREIQECIEARPLRSDN